MLRELHITNFALIDELRAEFGPGLNVLTGETGAGKSIIIDALGLTLGMRGEAEQIRTGADGTTVEAAFDRCDEETRELLADSGIEHPSDEFLLVRRVLLREGKSKAYLNGRLSSSASLRSLGELLVDVHGQHQGVALTQPSRQRLLLDAYAGLTADVAAFRMLYGRRQTLRAELDVLRTGERQKAQRLDHLQYQRDEIAVARLVEGEEEALNQERTILMHAERLHAAAHLGYEGLYGEQGAVAGRLAAIVSKLKDAQRIDPRLQEVVDGCEAAMASVEDAAAQLRDYREGVAFDPERLEQVESRLHEIGKLKRKYGGSIAEVLACARSAEEELQRLTGSEERGQEIERELAMLKGTLAQRAAELTARRKAAAERLAAAVQEELRALRMEKAVFIVQIGPRSEAGGSGLEANGADEVEFLIAPNPGEELKPMGRIASGGELSRVMLAIKAILAATDRIPTLIFDEVDVGIGGGMAAVVGQKLWAIAKERQVLSITHLPQIAALADRHFAIVKRVEGPRTGITVRVLEGEERVCEIARMLGARERSGTPLHHAREILETARQWKAAMTSGASA
ncbi:DNA repair protein recN (Recombination protein N) [Candidatus Methylomirabilis lanthanidiphila]|uniref:DNA repair protein RecN n=1 Tax=Candidatus Methylomirabilis lanthanidiphila TaxID=2211376 RepID=A0A564ZHY1_9BACT|nr:DNA repair protein RecN [Candidatus Methylomirabilis lanthanidiphila]VUZ84941.1 DNA repair protein recN (Recombination protein N) [Candidatus Methylomirabilis lanthanidiphila]